jgi:hypothetical protein
MPSVPALSLAELQQENTRLLALLGQQEHTIQQQKTSIQTLQHQLHLFRTARFGRKLDDKIRKPADASGETDGGGHSSLRYCLRR